MKKVFQKSVSKDEGFALVLVLAITAILSALAIMIFERSRLSASVVASDLEATRSQLLMNAGISRSMALLADHGDHLRPAPGKLPDEIEWQFEEAFLTLRISSEGGKLDANFASPRLRERTPFRNSSRQFARVDSILPPCKRLSKAARKLRDHYTTYTKSSGLSPHVAPIDLLESLHILSASEIRSIDAMRADPTSLYLFLRGSPIRDLLSDEVPVFTVTANLRDKPDFERAAIIRRGPKPPHVSIIAIEDRFYSDAPLSC